MRILSADCTFERGKKEKKRRPSGRLFLSCFPRAERRGNVRSNPRSQTGGLRPSGFNLYLVVSCFACAVPFFGHVNSITPSAYFALERASFTSLSLRQTRDNLPKLR